MKIKFTLAVFILLSAVVATSCGFRVLKGSGAPALNSSGYKKYNNISEIYIKPFKNLTYKSGAGVYFSNNIVNYLNVYTDMFTANKSNALYYLTGKITSIQNNVTSYTGVAAAVDYMITVTVAVNLYKANGSIVFRHVSFSSSASYYNYINPLIAHKQEKTAIETASKRIARKISLYIESKRLTS